MTATDISIRVDNEIKVKAQEVFTSLGLDMTAAINIFLLQTIRQHDIPFTVAMESEKKIPMPGCLKGKIWMAEDFDAPLEDFKEYME